MAAENLSENQETEPNPPNPLLVMIARGVDRAINLFRRKKEPVRHPRSGWGDNPF